jgi:cell division septum initiation protein DivIVA
MATEDREAYENDISDLQDRVKRLEDKLAAVQSGAASSMPSKLPSDAEFEQSLGYMERFMRRFMDVAKSFDSEPEKPANGAQQ